MSENGNTPITLEINEIMSLLPHRYPFLLVDRVLEVIPHTSIHAVKNVTINEPFFLGHFPGNPIMPGVLLCEALAQAGALLLFKSKPELQGKLFLFAGMEKVRFRHPVVPGDQIHLHCFDIRNKLRLWKMDGLVKVGDNVAAELALSAALVDRSEA